MAYNYTTYSAALAEMMVTSVTDTDFVAIEPSIIDAAEQRMYRELDILNTVVRDSSANLSANSRNFTLPQAQGRFVVVNGINVVTPISTTVSTGTRNPVVPVSRDLMDAFWPTNSAASSTTIPAFFAMITDQEVIFGPPPGDTFNVEIIGTIRPTPLSADNETTYLSLYLPDAFLACSMIFASGFQKNFGAQADDPKMAASWESQYQTLMASANVEEQRKRFAGQAWGSLQPTSIATANR